MFKEQEQPLLKILSSCKYSRDTLKQRLTKLTLQATDSNNNLKEICKEIENFKLSLDASLNIYEDKRNKAENV